MENEPRIKGNDGLDGAKRKKVGPEKEVKMMTDLAMKYHSNLLTCVRASCIEQILHILIPCLVHIYVVDSPQHVALNVSYH